jgi:hypothetical protein
MAAFWKKCFYVRSPKGVRYRLSRLRTMSGFLFLLTVVSLYVVVSVPLVLLLL